MGKKKGQQQRTKGNVLPSSSVRSADLLMKGSGQGLFPSSPSSGLGNIPELAGLDSIANVEFRTVLKKLYKRDVTTKLKALVEFADLCRSCKQHEVLTVLPYWPRVYNKLFEDNDRRVREHAQNAMNAIAEAAGKNLALQLKNIMGCWFISQCDPYSPASMSADAGISKAFSNNKKIEAFAFCRKDILKTITSYIFGPQAKREKLTDQEGNNFNRILASSLEALSLFIQTVTNYSPDKEEMDEIIGDSKFWKFQKHASDSVRAGFYSVIEHLCTVSPSILETHLTDACKSVFHRLNESNGTVCKPLYSAAVAIVATYEKWHEAADINKGLIPGLCSILKAGCYGLSSIVLPSLLPILAKLPNSADIIHIFSKIFESIKICLDQDKIRLSRHGSEQAISAQIELCRLLVSRTAVTTHNDDESIINVTNIIIKENVMKTIIDHFSGKGNKLISSILYQRVSEAIGMWTRKMLDPDVSILYSKLFQNFWSDISALAHDYIKEENLPIMKMLIQFLDKLLNHSSEVKHITIRRSVKFSHDSPPKSTTNMAETKALDKQYEVQSLIREKINMILIESGLLMTLKDSEEMLSIYSLVFKHFGSPSLLISVYQKIHVQQNKDAEVKVIDYIEHVLLSDVDRISKTLSSSDEKMSHLVSDLLFNAIIHCEPSHSFPIDLSNLMVFEAENPKFLIMLHLLVRLTGVVDSNHKIAIWMTNIFSDTESNVFLFLKSLIDCISQCSCEETIGKNMADDAWFLLENILTVTFKSDEKTGFICGEDGFKQIISNMLKNLKRLENNCTSSQCYISFLQKFATLMLRCVNHEFGENLDATTENIWEDLLTSLLHSYYATEDVMPSLLSLFTKYSVLAKEASKPFVRSYALNFNEYISSQLGWIKKHIILSNPPSVTDASSRIEHIFYAILTNSNQEENVMASEFFENLFPTSQEWNNIRGFITDDSSYNLERRSSSELGYSSSHCTTSDHYLSVVNICVEIVKRVHSVLSENKNTDISWKEIHGLSNLTEEYVISCAITNGPVQVEFFDILGEKFGVAFRKNVMEKAMTIGGVWPSCVSKIKTQFDENEIQVPIDALIKTCDTQLEIGLPLFETMSNLIANLSQDKLLKILLQLNSRMASESFGDYSPSEIYYIFSLGISMLCEVSEKDLKNEFLLIYLDHLITWRSDKEELFLFDDTIKTALPEVILLNCEFAHLFTLAIRHLGDALSESQWDLICCSVVSWIDNVSNYLDLENVLSVFALKMLTMTCTLKEEIETFMASPMATADPTIPQNLVSEWTEFFSMSIYTSLVKIFLNLPAKNIESSSIVSSICNSLKQVSAKSILESSANLKPRLSPDSALPEAVQTLLNHLCPWLYPSTSGDANTNIIQLTVFHLLSIVLDQLVTKETVNPPVAIFNIVKRSSKNIASVFMSREVETMKAAPDSDSDEDNSSGTDEEEKAEDMNQNILLIEENIVTILAYLLSWKLLINMTTHIHAENKTIYIDNLMKENDSNLVDDLLPKLFKLMVGQATHFKTDPEFTCNGVMGLDLVEHIAASVYKDFLMQMPATSRSWFNNLAKGARSKVDKFTSTFVSPFLISKEFKAVQLTKQQQNVEGMEIIARPTVREVHASYQLNEVQMEIVVCLSANHPLGPITVNTEKRAGVVMGQWRYWILQITTFLQYRNGGIIDGLLLWKDKVDKRFEGLEECMICFSLVHGSSQSLPKLKCKTCKKKYHAECLYKWFDTSSNSTCPNCRSPMIFR
uniref:E3 ubiquitin-protein ligase listerin-like n=1 Tax=Styela clava TaxID=7725 RepID=UPI00193966AB|nr:E3 ubiquitin-protein ligase listerin-like [Styela clava]